MANRQWAIVVLTDDDNDTLTIQQSAEHDEPRLTFESQAAFVNLDVDDVDALSRWLATWVREVRGTTEQTDARSALD